jgi:hypothetical protein
MKFRIVLLIFSLLGVFITAVFLSDFLVDKNEAPIFDKYSVMQINGEYNLMCKEKQGYSLVVPSVLKVYSKEGNIIAVSDLDGSYFINNKYKSNYSSYSNREYFYCVSLYGIQEVSKNEFLNLKKSYNLVWSLK